MRCLVGVPREVFFFTISSKNATCLFDIYNCVQGISNDSASFTFTGKEKDEETGYGYFGARYMDHELMTMWLSVDPMADKYPSISPYAYCAWNPVKLVDPDGRDIYRLNTSDGSLTLYHKTKDNTDKIIAGSFSGIGRAKRFKETNSTTISKGVLDGRNGADYSKSGFTSSDGNQEAAIDAAKFISYNLHVEVSGAGFTAKNGDEDAQIFGWSNNTFKSSDNPANYSAPQEGSANFHFHIHCEKTDGTLGYGIPSNYDKLHANKTASFYGEDNFYIISPHDGVTQYNQYGVIRGTSDSIPNSLRKHQRK